MEMTGGCLCRAVRYSISGRTHRHPHLLVPRLPIHRRRQRHREHLLPERGGDGER